MALPVAVGGGAARAAPMKEEPSKRARPRAIIGQEVGEEGRRKGVGSDRDSLKGACTDDAAATIIINSCSCRNSPIFQCRALLFGGRSVGQAGRQEVAAVDSASAHKGEIIIVSLSLSAGFNAFFRRRTERMNGGHAPTDTSAGTAAANSGSGKIRPNRPLPPVHAANTFLLQSERRSIGISSSMRCAKY